MKCHNYKCEFNNRSRLDSCMRPNFTQNCSIFWAEPDNKPNGLNIHQPEAEFETITISLNTKEAARDFFVIMSNVDLNSLTPVQTKEFYKIYKFKESVL